MQFRLSTADAPGSEQLDYWQDIVCRTFFLAECSGTSERPFHGSIDTSLHPGLAYSRLSSREQRVVRTAEHVRRTPDALFMINLQIKGTGTFAQDGRDVVLRPGDFTCTDSTRVCGMEYGDDFEQLIFALPRDVVTRAIGGTDRLTATPINGASPLGSLVSTFLQGLGERIGQIDPTTAARLGETGLALVLTALGEITGLETGRQAWGRLALRQRAHQWLDIHARDPEMTSATAAAALGISLRYLQDLFRDEGVTPSEWIWRRRLEIARHDIANPRRADASLSQIAFECGFSDAAHFSRRFKATFGLSPRDYRVQALAKRDGA